MGGIWLLHDSSSDSEIQILKWVLGQHRGKWELLTFDATQIMASQWLASPFSILRALNGTGHQWPNKSSHSISCFGREKED